jgi:serine/threonine-protein kinase
VSLALVAGVAAAAWHFLDPDRPRRSLERRLAGGEAVTLIADRGPPQWFDWRLQEGGGVSLNPEGLFTVRADNLSLLDLMTDPQTEAFRFEVQVRHERGDRLSEVGLYFAATSMITPKGVAHSFYQLGYNDAFDETEDLKNLPIPPNPLPTENMVRFVPRFAGALTTGHLGGFSPRLFKAAGIKGGGWHTLRIDAGPETVAGFWDDKAVGRASWNDIRDGVARDLARNSKRHPDLVAHGHFPAVPRSPLGIFVQRGTAAFRNITLEPRPH